MTGSRSVFNGKTRISKTKAVKSRKRKPLTAQEKLEALRMLDSGRLSFAVMYKFGATYRFVRKLKREGASLLEEAEK